MDRAMMTALGFLLAAGPLVPEALARAGGGSNGGGRGGGIASLIYLFLLPFFMAYAWWKNNKIKEKNQAAGSLLSELAKKDPAWQETRVLAAARTAFHAVQDAWCTQDLPALRELLEPELYSEWEQEITALHEKGWINKMEGLKVKDIRVVEVKNFKNDAQDSFSACVDAGAMDYMVDRSGAIVESNTSDDDKRRAHEKSFEEFTEFWTFVRRGDKWKVQRVDDDDEWDKTVDAPLVDEDAAPR